MSGGALSKLVNIEIRNNKAAFCDSSAILGCGADSKWYESLYLITKNDLPTFWYFLYIIIIIIIVTFQLSNVETNMKSKATRRYRQQQLTTE